MSALVELRGVSKLFGNERAVSGLSLPVERDRVTVLIGPSGCGKSTVLRIIVGLEKADRGEILYNAQPITAASLRTVRQRIGYVIQDGGLFPHLTARENLSLQSALLAKPRSQISQRIDELCELTRLPKNALARYPLELSGGQRQRVSLMRALMLSPELLLLDEPFAALDPLVRSTLQSELKSIARQLHQTAIFVTHDLAEAARIGDTIVLMKEGRIEQAGTFRDLSEMPATKFVTEFINAQRSTLLT
ncbi:MAG: ATP-binding cassette domain-containing protein [Verrucomicrobia bacterium]|nr:ATP-binding cassette domain-containing protein [Verrucomicrobiota bacterium]